MTPKKPPMGSDATLCDSYAELRWCRYRTILGWLTRGDAWIVSEGR